MSAVSLALGQRLAADGTAILAAMIVGYEIAGRIDEALTPAFRGGAWLFSRFRVFQQGNVQAYLLYVFLALIALLLWR